jgi:DNA modification methylase
MTLARKNVDLGGHERLMMPTNNLAVNLEYLRLIPRMASEQYEALKADIAEKGIRVPITVNREYIILDGYSRHQIAKELCINEVPIEYESFSDPFDEKEYVITVNTKRRQMTNGELAAAACELMANEAARAKARQAENAPRSGQKGFQKRDVNGAVMTPPSVPPVPAEPLESSTTPHLEDATVQAPVASPTPVARTEKEEGEAMAIAAKKVGVGKTAVKIMKRLREEAPGDPEVAQALEQVLAGKMKLTAANKILQKRDARHKREAKLAAIQAAMPAKQEHVPRIQEESCVTFLDRIQDRSVDLLLTDPPYMTDVEEDIDQFVQGWVQKALDKVKDTGRVYIFTGPYPKELRAYLNVLLSQDRLIFENILVWTYRNTIGPSTDMKYKNNWNAILYLRGKNALVLNTSSLVEKMSVQDFNAPDGRQANNFYKWQKPDELAELIIRHATIEGEMVIDPFVGSGTFLLAAAKMKRYCMGCEIKHDVVKLAVQRGCIKDDR